MDKIAKNFCLEQYRSIVGEWYTTYPTLQISQVWERLKARGIKTSYTSVKRLTRPFRRKAVKSYFPLSFSPGEEAQVDWFVVTHPILGTMSGFALILSFSRFLYARIFPRLSFEFFIEGHLSAFSVLGGITRALRYDNLKSVVIRREPRTYNAAFLEFAHHYGFEIRLCNVRAGNEKGRVERAIRTIRETFLNTANHHQTLRALNTALSAWLDEKNRTVHRTTGKPPLVLKAEERLRAIPQNPYLNRSVYPPKHSTKTGLIHFDTNQYSIPEHLTRDPLIIHAYTDRIEIYDEAGKRVATHPRSFERNRTFMNPLHRTFTRIAVKTKTDRIYSVIKNLDPAVEEFLTLCEHAGEEPFRTAYGIFRLLTRCPRSVILSAVREALAHGTPRLQLLQTLIADDKPTIEEEVRPHQKELLEINYQPRSLKEYSS